MSPHPTFPFANLTTCAFVVHTCTQDGGDDADDDSMMMMMMKWQDGIKDPDVITVKYGILFHYTK